MPEALDHWSFTRGLITVKHRFTYVKRRYAMYCFRCRSIEALFYHPSNPFPGT
jgi:hypothetical protein